MDSRTRETVHTIVGNTGAGVRLGGDTTSDGTQTGVYYNAITENENGGIKFQRTPQGVICGNTMRGNTAGDAIGSFGSGFTPAAACPPSVPRPIGDVGVRGGSSSTTLPTVVGATATPQTPQPTSPRPTATPDTSQPVPTQPSHNDDMFVIDGNITTTLEAERASTITGRFHWSADTTASGGAYEATTGRGMTRESDSALVFDLALTHGGTFCIWVRGQSQGGNADSFWLYSDAGMPIQANLARGTWSWHRANATLHLVDGNHQLTVANREDGAEIDALLLTKDANYTPDDGDTTHVSR